ncbi:hypothetical protein ACFFLM_00515 [Deinococcus oregonensis]|uniref:Uncharacterized protein n=1 Tax=Deinococcus oregonensis TaxID=1805970 RepID=A0ABV6ASS6_9DEIO
MPTIAGSTRAALDRRSLEESADVHQRIGDLEAILGLPLRATDLDQRLTETQLAPAKPNPQDPRAVRALEMAQEGWTLRDSSRTERLIFTQ